MAKGTMTKDKTNKALEWKTVKVKLSDLEEYEHNPVQISEREAKELAKSLKKYGNVIPYVAAAPSNGSKRIPLLDGRQRKMVSLQINQTNPKQVVSVQVPSRKLTLKEKQGLIIRLRKNTGQFDFDILANHFDVPDLLEWGFTEKELELGGFELEDKSKDAEPQVDRAAELLEKWKVKTGDLWQIGEHRLLCGDSTRREDVKRVTQGENIDMVFTDPPYGVNYEYSEHKDDPKEYEKLADGFWGACPDAPLKIITVGHKWNNYWFAKNPQGFLVWFDKTKQSPSNVAHLCKSELILIFGKVYERFAWDTLEIEQPRNDGLRELHTCPKPLELWQKIIEVQIRAAVIYEPFCGSGTTLVACQNLGRRGRAIEISPAYVAVTLQRMQDAFPELKIERVK